MSDSRRRRPTFIAGIAFLAVAVLAAVTWAVLWFTPVASVKDIHVEGVVNGNAQAIRESANSATGMPVARVDTIGVARSVASQPWVNTVTVSRSWPSAITVHVTEFQPALFVRASDGAHIIDVQGHEFTTVPYDTPTPAGVIELTGAPQQEAPEAGKVGIEPAAVEAVLKIVAALPVPVRDQVERINAPGPAEVTILFPGGKEFYVGSATMVKEKGRAVELLLPREELKWNVSNPHEPTTRT